MDSSWVAGSGPYGGIDNLTSQRIVPSKPDIASPPRTRGFTHANTPCMSLPEPPDDSPPASWQAAYPELKKIARARLYAAGPQAGLNTTALVNESFLKLADRAGAGPLALRFASRGHFYAYAAHVMRLVIVDLVRERQAERRGGGVAHVTLDTAVANAVAVDEGEALRVDEALTALAAVEPQVIKEAANPAWAHLALARAGLARVALAQGDGGSADQHSQAALASRQGLQGFRDVRMQACLWRVRAAVLDRLGRPAEARALRDQALAAARRSDAPTSPTLTEPGYLGL